MGVSPSIKMTTLHHYHCPLVRLLSNNDTIDFVGVIVNGVPNNQAHKLQTAQNSAQLAQSLDVDGAIVAADGCGNHHIDFISIMDELGKLDIPSVGATFMGTLGELVITSPHADVIIDSNKHPSGVETCVVGENNLTDYDAIKTIYELKQKLQQKGFKFEANDNDEVEVIKELTRQTYTIKDVQFGDQTTIQNGILTIRDSLKAELDFPEEYIKAIKVDIVRPGEHDFFVNSNLDFSPIACKVAGKLGEGQTYQLDRVTVMPTGIEDVTDYQICNFGSSEGILSEQVYFDRHATPSRDDYIIHIDFLLQEDTGHSWQSVAAAHEWVDRFIDEIRVALKNISDEPSEIESFTETRHPGKPKIALIKACSAHGCMYDTSILPDEPGGYVGSVMLRDQDNTPQLLSANQCLDGAIHSLV